MSKTKHNWNKLKAEFISGSTLKELSEKYQISFNTIKKHHRVDHWSDLRTKAALQTDEEIIEKTAKRQAKEAFDEIKNITKLIKEAQEEIKNVDASSKEGLLRSVNELYKTLGTYTKKTSEEIKHTGAVQVIPIFGDMKLNVKQE